MAKKVGPGCLFVCFLLIKKYGEKNQPSLKKHTNNQLNKIRKQLLFTCVYYLDTSDDDVIYWHKNMVKPNNNNNKKRAHSHTHSGN